jgi:hypothetical protein
VAGASLKHDEAGHAKTGTKFPRAIDEDCAEVNPSKPFLITQLVQDAPLRVEHGHDRGCLQATALVATGRGQPHRVQQALTLTAHDQTG